MRSGKNLLWLVIFASWCFSASPRAETSTDPAVTPDRLAAAGEWAKASAAYEESWRKGTAPNTAAFFYNFGTAHLRAGNAGAARAALWKAVFLAPFDTDARDNLRLTEGKLSGAVAPLRPFTWLSWWPNFARAIPWPWFLVATLASLVPALWGLGGVKSFSETAAVTGTSFLLALLCAGSLAISLWETRFPAAGVIAPTKILSGPAASFPPIGTLEPGTLVNMEERRDGWWKLRFTNAKLQEVVGWSESQNLLELR